MRLIFIQKRRILIFGKIDYINLLPFHVFLKKSSYQNSFKKSISYKKGVPSELNTKLKYGKIDAAIISSIESKRANYKKIDLGICANKRVDSVLVRKNSRPKKDIASATSNALARVLKINGEVIIGDRALREFLKNPNDFIDLAKMWHEKHRLPFVFARLCVRKNYSFYEKMARSFLNQKIKIPRYILNDYAKKRQIKPKDILNYLLLIKYQLLQKEKKALKLFLKQAKNKIS